MELLARRKSFQESGAIQQPCEGCQQSSFVQLAGMTPQRHRSTSATERGYSCNIFPCVLSLYEELCINHRGSGPGSIAEKVRCPCSLVVQHTVVNPQCCSSDGFFCQARRPSFCTSLPLTQFLSAPRCPASSVQSLKKICFGDIMFSWPAPAKVSSS